MIPDGSIDFFCLFRPGPDQNFYHINITHFLLDNSSTWDWLQKNPEVENLAIGAIHKIQYWFKEEGG